MVSRDWVWKSQIFLSALSTFTPYLESLVSLMPWLPYIFIIKYFLTSNNVMNSNTKIIFLSIRKTILKQGVVLGHKINIENRIKPNL